MGLLKKMINICGKPKDPESISDSKLKSFILTLSESESPPLLEQYLNNLNNQQLTSFMNGLLSLDVKKRLTAETAFNDPFISEKPPTHLLSTKKDLTFKEPLEHLDGQWSNYLHQEINHFIS